MAWLGTWAKRIKLTADNTKIDSDLSHFPLTVFLKAANGDTEKVFDEITTNNLKIAVTKTDGTTQLYVEIEKWDNPNQIGILHCGITGDTLASASDTDYYLYYDSAQDNNTTYVGVTDSVVAESVWDSNFKLVHHLVDATTSTVKDSTSNDDDGIKVAENRPIETTSGKIANAQDFEAGTADYITLTNTLTNTNTFTISAWIKTESGSIYQNILTNWNQTGDKGFMFMIWGADDKLAFASAGTWKYGNTAINTNWHHVAVSIDASNNVQFYLDGATDSSSQASNACNAGNTTSYFGKQGTGSNYFDGIIDEGRFSSAVRPVAWIKGEFNSGNDTLLAYGSEELLPTITGAAFLLQMI